MESTSLPVPAPEFIRTFRHLQQPLYSLHLFSFRHLQQSFEAIFGNGHPGEWKLEQVVPHLKLEQVVHVHAWLKETQSDKLNEEEPMKGMVFDSAEAVFMFYESYAKRHGFAVRKRSHSKDTQGVKYVQLVCARALRGDSKSKNSDASNITKPTSSQITGCRANLRAKRLHNGTFELTVFTREHNHALSPSKASRFRQYRHINARAKKRLLDYDAIGMRTSKSWQCMVAEKGGYDNVPFNEKDVRNLVNKARRLKLGAGDADALHKYFLKMQDWNPNFFYSMDLNEHGHLRNVFWADARSRVAFEAFGDVVTFDTTCLTNKYDMPFAPFIGVNHHGQTILLGCGLLANESANSFLWLFETWKSCMKGVTPRAIITDQCKGMKKAIRIVFPEVRHRWCLWHIMKKIPEKLSRYKQYKPIKKCLKNAVYESLTPDIFEERWKLMFDMFFPKGNKWLQKLYKDKKLWVPVFLKDIFWAGMSTTQRSEGVNAFFDKYVNSKTSLKIFVEQYGLAMLDKIEKEKAADFASFSKSLKFFSKFSLEKQFHEAYTNEKFKEFQNELMSVMYCSSPESKKEGSVYTYKVTEAIFKRDIPKGSTSVFVEFNTESCDIKCLCRLFECKGILCRHVISILLTNGVNEVPSKYILSRWRKDLKLKYTFIMNCYEDPKSLENRLSYNRMCDEFHELAAIAECEEEVNVVLHGIKELKEKIVKQKLKCNVDCKHETATVIPQLLGIENSGAAPTSPTILCPNIVQRKGRPAFKRKISTAEEMIQKKSKKNNQQASNKIPKAQEQQVHTQAIIDEDWCDIGTTNFIPLTNLPEQSRIQDQHCDLTPPILKAQEQQVHTQAIIDEDCCDIGTTNFISSTNLPEQSRIQDQHCDFTPHIASYTQLLNMVSMGCYTGHNYSINHHDYQGIKNRALYGPNMCRSPFIRKLLEKDLNFKDEELLVVDYAFDGKHTKSEEDIVCLDDFKGREYFMTRYECATLEGTTWFIDEVINMYVRIKNINDATGERYIFLPYLTVIIFSLII